MGHYILMGLLKLLKKKIFPNLHYIYKNISRIYYGTNKKQKIFLHWFIPWTYFFLKGLFGCLCQQNSAILWLLAVFLQLFKNLFINHGTRLQPFSQFLKWNWVRLCNSAICAQNVCGEVWLSMIYFKIAFLLKQHWATTVLGPTVFKDCDVPNVNTAMYNNTARSSSWPCSKQFVYWQHKRHSYHKTFKEIYT